MAVALGSVFISFSLAISEPLPAGQLLIEEVPTQAEAVPSQECDEAAPADNLLAKSGCCSWHGGVCGCSGGRALCCDGALSPTCGC
jgi:hypothetical protein